MKDKKCPTSTSGKFNQKPLLLHCTSTSSQRARILKHFEACPHLSTFEARNTLCVLHPAGRILELKKKGYLIDRHWTTECDARGVPHRIAMYVFKGRKRGGNHANH